MLLDEPVCMYIMSGLNGYWIDFGSGLLSRCYMEGVHNDSRQKDVTCLICF